MTLRKRDRLSLRMTSSFSLKSKGGSYKRWYFSFLFFIIILTVFFSSLHTFVLFLFNSFFIFCFILSSLILVVLGVLSAYLFIQT